jgi:hypothetical protein
MLISATVSTRHIPDAMRYNAMRYNAMRYNAMQYSKQTKPPLINPHGQRSNPKLNTISYALRRQRSTQSQHAHARKCTNKAEPAAMGQVEALGQQLQTDHRHDASRGGKHAPVYSIFAAAHAALLSSRKLEPRCCDSRAQRLADAAQHSRHEHGFPPRVEREVQRQSQSEALGDVVDEEGEENGEAQSRVCVVGRVRYKALGDLMQRNGRTGL